jgi:hypothetical protein
VLQVPRDSGRGAAHWAHSGKELEVAPAGKALKVIFAVGNKTERRLDRSPGTAKVMAGHCDAFLRRLALADQHANGAALARPIASEQAEEFPPAQLQVEPINGNESTVQASEVSNQLEKM